MCYSNMIIENTKKRKTVLALTVLTVLISSTGATILTNYGTISGIVNVESSLEIENPYELNSEHDETVEVLNNLEEVINDAELADEDGETIQNIEIDEDDGWKREYELDLSEKDELKLKIDSDTVQEVELS